VEGDHGQEKQVGFQVVRAIVQPEAGVTPIVQAIRRARTSIDICIFRLDRKEIETALEAAVARGVRVRALIAHTNKGGGPKLRKLEQRLLAGGVMVTRTSDDFVRYHGKYMIADHTLHVFAFNLTKLDLTKSRSFAISTRDVSSVKEASKVFEADTTRQPYEPARSNLVVSPETARAVLGRFLTGAKKELAIYDVKVQDSAMIKVLEERARRARADHRHPQRLREGRRGAAAPGVPAPRPRDHPGRYARLRRKPEPAQGRARQAPRAGPAHQQSPRDAPADGGLRGRLERRGLRLRRAWCPC
jgi:hypothetical protein